MLLGIFPALSQTASSSTYSFKVDSMLMCGPFVLQMPAFTSVKNVKNAAFDQKELFKSAFTNMKSLIPADKKSVRLSEGNESSWRFVSADTSGKYTLNADRQTQNRVYLFATHLRTDKWVSATIEVETSRMCELYVNGVLTGSKYKSEKENEKSGVLNQDVKWEQGAYLLVIKVFAESELQSGLTLKCKITTKTKSVAENVHFSLHARKYYNIYDLLYGTHVTDISISPQGDYYLLGFTEVLENNESRTWKELFNYESGKLVSVFRSGLANVTWLPSSNKLSYREGGKLYIFDPDKGKETLALPEIKGLTSYYWSKDGRFIIFTLSDKMPEDKTGVKKLEGMPDRQAGYRSRTQLYKADLASGNTQQLTFGRLGATLHDISPDGKYLIFSLSEPDYQNRPFSRQSIYRLSLLDMKTDSLWTSGFYASVAFWGSSDRLVVHGGPSTFGKIGENLSSYKIPNNYDRQLYIYQIGNKEIRPVTLKFNPSVINCIIPDNKDYFYLIVNDKDYQRLYRFNNSDGKFTRINLASDMIQSFSISDNAERAVYIGSGVNDPPKAYRFDVRAMKYTQISSPGKSKYEYIVKGDVVDFSFVSSAGKTIDGRLYFPPDFDAKKKYPIIVNYYAGTTPISRDFGGRYPKELYAALGYIVYVPQPSGAIGWGQDFSAAHVNNWGKTVASEIIEGTQKVIKQYACIDAKRIGCIGASYGGFMTMFLITQTNMFAAAVSHAGISSISSYWGEGYWGYLYSAEASAESYPWSNKELYVDQSPLFNADKVNTPILLLHGMDDTNVPPGESIQFYTALKLLGKNVEFIQVEGQNHAITDIGKRIIWFNSIMAWFDKLLKSDASWWNELYPPGNY